jgi:hypothetical protein
MDAYEQEQADKNILEKLTRKPELDLSAYYSVAGYEGISFYLRGYATEWTEEEWIYDGEGDPDDEGSYLYNEPEEVESTSMVRAVMVGDDRVHLIDVADLTLLDEEDFCHGCGQIGCGH